MAVLTSQIAREIIETAQLPKRPARARLEAKPPVKLKSTDAQALVVGSSLVVAAENVPARVRSSGTTLEAHKSVINVLSTLLGPSAAAVVTQVLFFKFKANSTKLRYARGNATIYEAGLRRNRKLVAERLEVYQTAHVGEVRFPPTPAAG
jgi:hypothetical protein